MAPARFGNNDISRISGRGIFFDANVLIYLFADVPPTERNLYSSLFRRLLAQKNLCCIDVIVISEFINVWLSKEYQRAIHDKARKFTGTRKDFRNTADGQQALNKSHSEIKTVLNKFQLISHNWTEQDVIDLLVADNCDFNDKLIIKICQDNNFVLLTNDADFASAPIDILTTNNRLLNS